jgi:hypothetical protein
MKRITEYLAWCCVELSLWLHDKQYTQRLADWLWFTGYKLRKPAVPVPIFTPSHKDEWMYDWLYHYNSYTKTWHAYHREDSNAYWSGMATTHKVIEASCVTSLLQKVKDQYNSTKEYEYTNGY